MEISQHVVNDALPSVIFPLNVTSDDYRYRVARLGDSLADIHPTEQERADQEEPDQHDDGVPVGVRQLKCQPESQRPEPAGTPLAGRVQAEVLGLPAPRDQVTLERAGERA